MALTMLAETSEIKSNLTSEVLTSVFSKLLQGKDPEAISAPNEGFVRLPELENIIWTCPLELIVPNPEQPREYFDPAKMQELKGTISDIGQQDPIRVVPFFNGDKVQLFIIDGERRFRVLKELQIPEAKVEIRWKENEREIFKASLILNISKADHNPIELARAFQRLIEDPDPKWNPKTKPIQALSQELGISELKIKNHLKLLELPDEIQRMIMDGSLPPSNILSLMRGKKKGRATSDEKQKQQLDFQFFARKLVDEIYRDRESSRTGNEEGKPGKLTLAALEEAKRKALLSQGREIDVQRMDVHNGIYAVLHGSAKIANHAPTLTAEENEAVLVDSLRNRGEGQPPEIVRDKIKDVIEKLSALLLKVEKAINPPPMEKMANGSFADYLESNKGTFSSDTRFNMALAIARATDEDGRVITINEISEELKMDPNAVSGNIPLLHVDVSMIGLKLFQWDVRIQSNRERYRKIAGYRLEFIKKPVVPAAPQAVVPDAPQAVIPAVPQTLQATHVPVAQEIPAAKPVVTASVAKDTTAAETKPDAVNKRPRQETRERTNKEIPPYSYLVLEGRVPGVSKIDLSKVETEAKGGFKVRPEFKNVYKGLADEQFDELDPSSSSHSDLVQRFNPKADEVIIELPQRKGAGKFAIIKKIAIEPMRKKGGRV